METAAITNTSSLASAAAALQKSSREEHAEAIDSPHEERTETGLSLSQSAESLPELSESGLNLSASIQNRASQASESTIENKAQAQQAINELSISIQKSPDQVGAAQSNLTSNIVKSLLG